MRNTLLAVDLSNQLYKATAVNPTLSSADGRHYTGGLYGFLMAMQKAIKLTDATAVVLCRDSKPYKRSAIYPEYKALRKTKRDPEHAERVELTQPLIRKLSEVVAWPIWGIDGYESDDLVAHAVSMHRHRFQHIYAMSNDSDLYQLFQYPNFSVYRGGKQGIYTRDSFDKEHAGLPATSVPLMLAMTGTHNEIEGIHGIGPATALKILASPARLRDTMSKHRDVVDRNLGLIRLPYDDFPHDEPVPLPGKFHYREFVRFCSYYDIQASQALCEALEQVSKK